MPLGHSNRIPTEIAGLRMSTAQSASEGWMFNFKTLCRERPSIPSLCRPSITRASFLNTSNRLGGGDGIQQKKFKKKKKLTIKKFYQFKLNALFKLAEKSKKRGLTLVSSCQNIQNEVGRTFFLNIFINVSIRYKIISKY